METSKVPGMCFIQYFNVEARMSVNYTIQTLASLMHKVCNLILHTVKKLLHSLPFPTLNREKDCSLCACNFVNKSPGYHFLHKVSTKKTMIVEKMPIQKEEKCT